MVGRDVGRHVTSRWAFVARAAGAAFALLFFASAVPDDPSPARLQQEYRLAYSILVSFVVVVVFLAGPALGAAAIREERESRSLELLTLSGYGPWRVALAKVLGVLGGIGFACLAMLPLFGVALVVGGVEPPTVAAIVLRLAATGVWGVAGGVFFGIGSRSVLAAYLRTVFFLLFGVRVLLVGLLRSGLDWIGGLPGVAVPSWLYLGLSGFGVGRAPLGRIAAGLGTHDALVGAAISAGAALVVGAALVAGSGLALRRALRGEAPVGDLARAAETVSKRERGALRARWLARRWRGEPGPNPVRWRERVLRGLGPGAPWPWLALLAFGGLQAAIELELWQTRRLGLVVWPVEANAMIVALSLGVAVYVMLVLGSIRSLAGERRRGSLELLAASPLDVGRVVRGKLEPLAAWALIASVPLALRWASAVASGGANGPDLAVGGVSLVLTWGLLASVGQACGLLFAREGAAILAAIVVVLSPLLLLGGVIVGMLPESLLGIYLVPVLPFLVTEGAAAFLEEDHAVTSFVIFAGLLVLAHAAVRGPLHARAVARGRGTP